MLLPSLLAAVASIIVTAAPSSAAGVDLSLPDLHGRERSLSDYRGRVVVLNFWATWCGACREEMPTLISVGHQYEARGVEVIAVSLDDPGSERKVAAFVDELGIDFPVWVGGSTADLRRFGLEPALPGTVFIDRHGRIADRIVGTAGHAKLAAKLDALLGSGGGGSSPELEAISCQPALVARAFPL